MSRTTSPIVLALTLVTGASIGVLLDRSGPSVSAQVNGPPPPASSRPALPPRAASEDAEYEQLTRQYAQFEQVNRTFEMVSRVVSPAVVHIVAEKTGRTDETARVRHFEETGSGVIVRGDRARTLYVLTNNHVVEGSSPSKIGIFLQNGRSIHPVQVWLDNNGQLNIAALD